MSQLKICDFWGEVFTGFKVLKFSTIATTTQLLSSGEYCKLLYDTTPVKSASANVSFYTNNSKMPKFWVVTLTSLMSDISKACTGFDSSDTGVKVSSPTRGIDILFLLLFCVFFCDDTVLATSWYPVKGSYHISINERLKRSVLLS